MIQRKCWEKANVGSVIVMIDRRAHVGLVVSNRDEHFLVLIFFSCEGERPPFALKFCARTSVV